MRKVRHIKDLARLLAAALYDGAERVSATTFRWNCAGKCEAPVHFTLEGRAPAWLEFDAWGGVHYVHHTHPKVAPMNYPNVHDGKVLFIDMEAKCRKCAWCLKRRASEWSIRARHEIRASARTWFGTLTLRPEEHFLAVCRAEARAKQRGTRWAELSPSEQFKARHSAISSELTKWLKRIRKESRAQLRYCLVAEAHKSGLPHYHVLIHECTLGGTIRERTLRTQWKLGFSKFKLVEDSGAAWYVAKYLAKASEARVRASGSYGRYGLSP